MGRVTHSFPAKQAREIFSSAEDFFLAWKLLCAIKKADGVTPEFRTLGPEMVLGAFSTELFLKCLLVIEGAKTIPGTHNLAELFRNLSHKNRTKLATEWRQFMADNAGASKVFGDEMELVLSKAADYF